MLGALFWMIKNPREGLRVPDQLPHEEILEVANHYLGVCPSVHTEWTPLQNRFEPFAGYAKPMPREDDLWQFETFLA